MHRSACFCDSIHSRVVTILATPRIEAAVAVAVAVAVVEKGGGGEQRGINLDELLFPRRQKTTTRRMRRRTTAQ